MATTILKVVSDHHLFLVTLLIANAIALQSLPLVVHNLMPDWAAILFSTFIVLVVAQIVPQAYCTGPKKIILAYYASPIILVMIKIFWIISYPVAKGLDYLLGKQSHERIQHKDFATFLHDDVNTISILEIFKKYRKNVININFRTKNWKSDSNHDINKIILYD